VDEQDRRNRRTEVGTDGVTEDRANGDGQEGAERSIAAVAALSDPGRRAIYRLVSRSPMPASRDEVAAATGLSRSTAAFHLDRLAEAGLLEVEYRRLTGKSGPGSGRPAKLYVRAGAEVSVTLPQRHYDLAAHVLASAIERSAASGTDVRSALRAASEEAGRAIGAGSVSLLDALEDHGFEPVPDEGDIVLGTCPFHRLAQQHTALVCDANRFLVEGIRAGAEDESCAVLSDPGAGRCCVRISRERATAGQAPPTPAAPIEHSPTGENHAFHDQPHPGAR
jgi:predicted ArsR family transcriptional regulator